MLRASRRLPLSLGLLAALAALGAAWTASSQTPSGTAAAGAAPSGTASAGASGTASAGASGTASAAPAAPRVIKGSDVSAETSDAPKTGAVTDEWDKGTKVVPNRGAAPCEIVVLREWLRIRCDDRIGATLFAGDPTDVKIWATGGQLVLGTNDPRFMARATIVMRLRRGETKMFTVIGVEEGYSASAAVEKDMISVSWREDRQDPTILVSRR